jgi:hypothetical protein
MRCGGAPGGAASRWRASQPRRMRRARPGMGLANPSWQPDGPAVTPQRCPRRAKPPDRKGGLSGLASRWRLPALHGLTGTKGNPRPRRNGERSFGGACRPSRTFAMAKFILRNSRERRSRAAFKLTSLSTLPSRRNKMTPRQLEARGIQPMEGKQHGTG